MIQPDDIFPIGYISKHRGLRGEVELNFTDDAFDTGSSPYLFLDMDGLPVPFFWEEYRFKNDETAIFKFADIDTDEAARRLVGHTVYYPKCHLAPVDEDTPLASYRQLTGFTVSDIRAGELGRVTQVDDSSANVLLYILRPDGTDVIVPYHDDFLHDFDLGSRTLQLQLPEGILSLNDD